MHYMTTAQAAASLGLHQSRILAFIADGRLKAAKIGTQWMIEPSALEAVRNRKRRMATGSSLLVSSLIAAQSRSKKGNSKPYNDKGLLRTHYLTTAQAAVEIGLGPKSILAFIASGRLKAKKFGKEWRIEPSALEAVRKRNPRGRPRKDDPK